MKGYDYDFNLLPVRIYENWCNFNNVDFEQVIIFPD